MCTILYLSVEQSYGTSNLNMSGVQHVRSPDQAGCTRWPRSASAGEMAAGRRDGGRLASSTSWQQNERSLRNPQYCISCVHKMSFPEMMPEISMDGVVWGLFWDYIWGNVFYTERGLRMWNVHCSWDKITVHRVLYREADTVLLYSLGRYYRVYIYSIYSKYVSVICYT